MYSLVNILTPILEQLKIKLLSPPLVVEGIQPSKQICLEVIHQTFISQEGFRCVCDKNHDVVTCLLQGK